MFRWKLDHVVLATPARLSPRDYKLEFVEGNSALNHKAWSVGLTQRGDGGVNFYVNLMDNGPYHEGDVCIGRVVSGMKNLKKLLSLPADEETKQLDPAVSIRSMAISTVPKRA